MEGVDPHLPQPLRDVDLAADDPDRPGQGVRQGEDLGRVRRDVIAAGGRDPAHRHDHRLARLGLDERLGDLLRGDRRSAAGVHAENDRGDLLVGRHPPDRGREGVAGDLCPGSEHPLAAAVDDVAEGVDDRDVGHVRRLRRDQPEEGLELAEVEGVAAGLALEDGPLRAAEGLLAEALVDRDVIDEPRGLGRVGGEERVVDELGRLLLAELAAVDEPLSLARVELVDDRPERLPHRLRRLAAGEGLRRPLVVADVDDVGDDPELVHEPLEVDRRRRCARDRHHPVRAHADPIADRRQVVGLVDRVVEVAGDRPRPVALEAGQAGVQLLGRRPVGDEPVEGQEQALDLRIGRGLVEALEEGLELDRRRRSAGQAERDLGHLRDLAAQAHRQPVRLVLGEARGGLQRVVGPRLVELRGHHRPQGSELAEAVHPRHSRGALLLLVLRARSSPVILRLCALSLVCRRARPLTGCEEDREGEEAASFHHDSGARVVVRRLSCDPRP